MWGLFKMKFRCSCLSLVEVKIKETKRGHKYVLCPLCKVVTGLNPEKISGYTGYNVDEIIQDLK